MDAANSSRAFGLIPPPLRDLAAERLANRDWPRLFSLVQSEVRPALAAVLWPGLELADKPTVLVEAISGGDAPSQYFAFFWQAFDEVMAAGLRVFDGDAARARYAELPESVTVFRGTNEAEVEDGVLGICWTLRREQALWFATQHGRFRNTDSAPVVVTATVDKAAIVGMLLDRDEDEVLLRPFFGDVAVDYVGEEA